MTGIYIHIPFCLSKCRYCAFNSYPSRIGVPEAYVDALIEDIISESLTWNTCEFTSAYFGGGTPSLLSPVQIERIMDAIRIHLRLKTHAEITVECNPKSVDRVKINAFRDLGMTRLSLGVQSMSESELRVLGRSHGVRDTEAGLRMAASGDFDSMSVDVMLGIPGQSQATLDRTLSGILDHADHVSAYVLSVERGTELEHMVRAGVVVLPPEGAVLSMYEQVSGRLAARGFGRYEISNWSMPGHECVHNRTYWERGNYVGIGAGAHSHRDGVRYSKVNNPQDYAIRLRSGLSPVDMRERLTESQMLLEDIMLGLRTTKGIDLRRLSQRYEIDTPRLATTVDDLVRDGLCVRDGKKMQLSPRGIKVCDAVCEAVASAL